MDNGKRQKQVILPMTVLKRFDDILAPTLSKKPLLKRLRNFKHKVQTQGMIPVLDKVMALLYYDSVS
ncbi:MAG: hypothetical protein U0N36_03425 [Eubacterium sp.]